MMQPTQETTASINGATTNSTYSPLMNTSSTETSEYACNNSVYSSVANTAAPAESDNNQTPIFSSYFSNIYDYTTGRNTEDTPPTRHYSADSEKPFGHTTYNPDNYLQITDESIYTTTSDIVASETPVYSSYFSNVGDYTTGIVDTTDYSRCYSADNSSTIPYNYNSTDGSNSGNVALTSHNIEG
jgi:hypothetical protein